MSFVALAVGGSALLGYMGAQDAADAQRDASGNAIASNERTAQMQIQAQKDMFERQVDLQKPFRDMGLQAQQEAWNMARYGADFNMNHFQADPGYAFRLKEGTKAMDASAAARGGLISGNALRAAQKYGQDMGSQEYQNAFNRFQVNRSNKMQAFQSLGGIGQSATNTLSNAAGQMGQGISNAYGQLGQGNAQAYTDMGNARASGYMGGANALAGGLGQYLNYNQGQQAVNALRGGGGFNYGASAGLGAADYYSAF